MTHFEAVGVTYQYSAKTMRQAKRALQKSCTKCGTQGKPIQCAQCAIASVHRDIINFVIQKGN